ncbi:DUF4255 domain-containing protein [Lentzea sp. NPDC005914]|uniref:DUF4255 domain-containing protein n=1 Tax=Lentzea sp. NPDC005914 TaxID=3154572 RepID=UPI0034014F06
MLHLLDESLEEFLRAEVPLPRSEIDIAFAAPDKEWSARVSRPTINLYLWDVRRNLSARELGIETVRSEDGQVRQRPPLPKVDCRYLITAWTSDMRDEHALLGATLAALLRVPELDGRYLHEMYRSVKPIPSLTLGLGGGQENSDFWSALGGQLKPGLDVTVTATVDIELLVPAGPPVLRYSVTATPEGGQSAPRLFVGGHSDAPEGTIIATNHGATQVRADGTFVLSTVEGDEVRVGGEPQGDVDATGEIDLR